MSNVDKKYQMTIRSMTVTDARDATAKRCFRGPYKTRTKALIGGLIMLVILAALMGYFIGSADSARRFADPPDPEHEPPPSPSRLRVFEKAAVCTDAPHCSEVGKNIFLKNGSAVDAAIAAMFCNGIFNQQSMGIGGGFFMTVYVKNEQKAYVVNAREKAPGAATQDMYGKNKDTAQRGPLSPGVPGEVRGMWEAHRRWGKLPWADLVEPTLKLCEDGYPMSSVMYDGLLAAPHVQYDPNLRKQYFDDRKGQFHKIGTIIKPTPELCRTLKKIAEKGGDELYNGTLAGEFLADLQQAGSIITADDLRNYQAEIVAPLEVVLPNGDRLYSAPPPASGAILALILNILRGYNLTKECIANNKDKILTYHRIIEAFKFGYGMRTKLGDPHFVNLTEMLANITSPEYGSETRLKINDSQTSNDPTDYGAETYNKPDAGTAHISIIAPNGDAVAMTSSVNYYFGARFSTFSTGIIMNNVMDDFSSPGFPNDFGVPPSPANFIRPGKRPQSSMSPSIIIDEAGNAKLVIGASGGTKITTAVAWTAIRKLWFDESLKQAVDSPRMHHQLLPMKIEYQYGIPKKVVQGLKEKGHKIERYNGRGSIVCGLFRNSTAIYANADYRKGGDVSGF